METLTFGHTEVTFSSKTCSAESGQRLLEFSAPSKTFTFRDSVGQCSSYLQL